MHRRTLLTAALSLLGSGVAGCLERGEGAGDSGTDGDGSNTPTDSMTTTDGDDATNGDTTTDGGGDHETRFEVLDAATEFEESATVTFDDAAVTVTGTIMGNNTCYTAKLGELTVDAQMLRLNVESYEDRDEDEGCGEALIGIDYKAVVRFDGDRPTDVTVEHNGDVMTTAQDS